MRILEYTGLDTAGVAAQYRKATEAIAREDFRAAEVKKLVNLGHGKFYRARLDGANRLLFGLVRHGGETCALMLEVIANHDYRKSRFLRGMSIDETKIADVDATAARAEAQPVRYLHSERTAVHFREISRTGREEESGLERTQVGVCTHRPVDARALLRPMHCRSRNELRACVIGCTSSSPSLPEPEKIL
jgi:hypothetical protein